jgi:arabinogalactan oligomer/maltooligosaccharide transport system substrate-binding protein
LQRNCKILSLALCGVLAISPLTGCSSGSSGSSSTAAPATSAAAETTTESAAPVATDASTEAAATAAAGGETISLKVWGSQDDQTILQQMVDSFKAAHPENTYDIELGAVGESDAATRYSEDPAAAADVFAFAGDQINTLVGAGGLYEITRNKDAIVAENSPDSIEAATINNELYAYPMTGDNGYFLYYDKSVLSDSDVATLDGIMAKADQAGKKVFMDVSNGYYIAAFFLGAGCTLSISPDGKQLCDFNNAKGLAAAEAIKAFTADPGFLTGDDSVFTAGIGSTICAGVSGIWNSEAVKTALGDNMGCVKLPTFTCDGQQVQMGGFAGYKLIGVNSQTQQPIAAMDLAEWLTNEANQKLRYEQRGAGPTNINVANSPEVQENAPLAALKAQYAFCISQKDVLNAFWSPAEAFGTAMESKDYSQDLQSQLDTMVAQITQ